MTTTDLDSLTDKLAKSNSDMFSVAEKLLYYNIGYGLLYGMIIDEQEDNYEEEDTKTTVAGRSDYKQKARIHHVNWVKVDYGSGFVPLRHKSEQELLTDYGNEYEDALDQWNISDPIYYYKGKHLFIYPAPTFAQAGAGRLWVSQELLPADLTAGATPDLPENFQYLLSVYAALTWLDSDDPLWAKRQKEWNEGTAVMLRTMFPRSRQAEMQAGIPFDTGEDY
jgi:hypothetical protein